MANEVNVRITGDAESLNRVLRGVEQSAGRVRGTFNELGSATGRFFDGISRRAQEAERRFNSLGQTMERNARRVAEAEARQARLNAANRAPAGGGAAGFFGIGGGAAAGGFAGGLAGGAAVAGLSQVAAYGRETIKAHTEASRVTLQLETAIRRAGVATASAREEVERLRRSYVLSESEAEKALAVATRAAAIARRPDLASSLLGAGYNLATGAGLDRAQAPALIDQIARGDTEAFQLLTGRRAESLYREAASARGIGVGQLSDADRVLVRLQAVIEAGNRDQAASATYLRSGVASWDRIVANTADIKEHVGGAILNLLQNMQLNFRGGGQPGTEDLRAGFRGSRYDVFDETAGAGPRVPFVRPPRPASFVQAPGFGALQSAGETYLNRLAHDESIAALAAREAGARRLEELRVRSNPLELLRLRYEAEQLAIGRQYQGERPDSPARLKALGEARDAYRYERGETEGDIRRAMRTQIDTFRQGFGSALSEAGQAIARGRQEAARLNEELAKLPASLQATADQVRIAQGQAQSFALAQGAAGSLANIGAVDARLGQFTSRYESAGYRTTRGFYGQPVTRPTFRRIEGESAATRIARVFATGDAMESLIRPALRGFRPDEAAGLAGVLSRSYQASSLAGFRPGDFNDQQRRQYQELLQQQRKDEIDQLILQLNEMRRIGNMLERLTNHVAGPAYDDKKDPAFNLEVTNRVAGTVARIADAAIAGISSGSVAPLFNENNLFGGSGSAGGTGFSF